MNGVTKAIGIVGLAELARRCNVTYQAVRKWEKACAKGEMPFERAKQVFRVMDGAVAIHELLDLPPDIFGPPAATSIEPEEEKEAA